MNTKEFEALAKKLEALDEGTLEAVAEVSAYMIRRLQRGVYLEDVIDPFFRAPEGSAARALIERAVHEE